MKGALRVKRGKRTQKLGTLVFSRGAKGGGQADRQGARQEGQAVRHGQEGRKAKTKVNRQTVSKVNATLTKRAAALPNKALKHKVFRAKQKIGTFQVTVSSVRAPVKPKPGAAVRRPLRPRPRPWPTGSSCRLSRPPGQLSTRASRS